jgi:hypothetical protein
MWLKLMLCFSWCTQPQVLVGFADKLRLMTVLMEDLKTVKELGIKVST